jgi:HEAT repeat protein
MKTFNASALVDVLINGTGAEKRKGIDWLDACTDSGERERLRALLIHHLTKTHAPLEDPTAESMRRRDARAWLLSALGRVTHGDAESKKVLKRHLDPAFEKHQWGRYWVLEGLFVGDVATATQFALESRDDESPLVRCLALAILARGGDPAALKILREEVEKDSAGGLRALRVSMVLDTPLLARVFAIVREGSYSDATYDAVIALGKVPSGTPEAEEAAEVLAGYVRRYRWPMYDSMRTNALVSLGQLRSIIATPVLLEELTDENPMIVLQAARALEATLGARTACRRILEAATEGTRLPQTYAGALRALNQTDVADELQASANAGTTQEADAALLLLRELGGAEALDRLSAMRRSAEAYVAAQSKSDEEIQRSIDRSLMEARQGFKIVARMDVTIFVAGFILLGIGVYLILRGGDQLNRLIGALASGTGFIGILLNNWLVSARDRIEPSVRRLASLQALFHGYLRQLRQVDQAYTQRVLEGELKPEEVRGFSEIVDNATQRTVAFLSVPEKTNGKEESTIKQAESVVAKIGSTN